MRGMIAPGSLSAFSSAAGVSRPQSSGAAAASGRVEKARAQASPPSGQGSTTPSPVLVQPGKQLPRGSLLNLTV